MKNKNILITGSNGFIGFNLKTVLIENGFKVLEFKKQNSLSFLKKQIQNDINKTKLFFKKRKQEWRECTKNEVYANAALSFFLLCHRYTTSSYIIL